jgi:hypothetical protein
MMIRKKKLSRRTLLRGTSAMIGLPLLDSMVPALASASEASASSPDRMAVVYVPHGAVMEKWTPKSQGTDFEFTPTLEPLEPFRDQLTVLSGLDNYPAVAQKGDPAGGHGRIGGAFLTGVHAKPTEGADVEAATSMDQIAASHFRDRTQLASLELAIEDTDLAGACDVGFSCSYVNTLSWSSPTTPLPTENNPRAVFERLFGNSETTDRSARLARLGKNKSILDSVNRKVSRLQSELGGGDRNKLGEYLEAVRDVERRIQIAESQSDRELPLMERPNGGIPADYEQHVKLMFDMQVLAFQSDMTRVISFMLSKELSTRTYPEIDVPDPHHPLSHHLYDPDKVAKCAVVNRFHAGLFAYYLDKLNSTADGNGSLLDSMSIIYGSGMSDSNVHDSLNLPIVLAGGANGKLRGGRHIRYAKGTPLTNLYMSVLDKLGIELDHFGDSTGKVELLSDV